MTTAEAIYLLGGASLVALLITVLSAVKRSGSGSAKSHELTFVEQSTILQGRAALGGESGPTPLVAELMTIATDHLEDRARKVHELLLNADPSREGLLTAVDRISDMSLVFIDHSRMIELAQQMRARILRI